MKRHQWYAVDRQEDVTGISGLGIIAWCLELNHGVLMFWDTEINGDPTMTVEWLPDWKSFTDIHGHGGRTVLVTVKDEDAGRGRLLMLRVIGDVGRTCADLMEEAHLV